MRRSFSEREDVSKPSRRVWTGGEAILECVMFVCDCFALVCQSLCVVVDVVLDDDK